jgi:hypothetical protein
MLLPSAGDLRFLGYVRARLYLVAFLAENLDIALAVFATVDKRNDMVKSPT